MPAQKGDFHAILQQVEPQLFQATYSGVTNPENPDARELPDSHIGSSAEAVMTWVELMALNLGYEWVVWKNCRRAPAETRA